MDKQSDISTQNLRFRRSGFSSPAGHCVEVAFVGTGGNGVVVRNSTRPEDVSIHFTKNEWSAFVSGVKAGEFDI